MQGKDTKETEKHPMDMTTDEALDYVFGSELADELKREAQQLDNPEHSDPEPDEH